MSLKALQALALLCSIAPLAGCDQREASPRFHYTLLDGSQHGSQALLGQVVLINFWATTCASCVAGMPQIVHTHQRFHARGLQTLAVAMQWDPPARVSQFAQARQLPFGVVIDHTGTVARAFGDVQVTPTFIVLDRRGAIAGRWVGEPDFPQLHTRLDRLLGEA